MDRISYQIYEMLHLAFAPARALTDATLQFLKSPLHPFANTTLARNLSASAELFERMTRRYGKPIFGLHATSIGGDELHLAFARYSDSFSPSLPCLDYQGKCDSYQSNR